MKPTPTDRARERPRTTMRAKRFPVVWTYVAYMESGEDCGVWGTRTNTPDSLQNIKIDSRRAAVRRSMRGRSGHDIVINKRMASAFFETNLGLCFHVSQDRHRDRDWRIDLRAACARRSSTACPVAFERRSGRMRRRQAREPAFREPLRHVAEICGRDTHGKGPRLPAEPETRTGIAVMRDPGLYDYLPYDERRPRIEWPAERQSRILGRTQHRIL